MAGGVTFFFSITAALLLVHQIHADSTNIETEELGSNPEFTYAGNTGPDKWGSLCPAYAKCSAGKSQSPINIVKDEAPINSKLRPIRREYYAVNNASLVNHGFNIGMVFGNAAGILIADGKNYTLQQMHWHVPSEHRIDGVSFDAELHLVHKAGDGSVSVVAILHKIGDADPILATLQDKLAELAKDACAKHEVAQVAVGPFETWRLRRNTHKFYRYIGSFTTPPCTENVLWHVFPRLRPISKEQVAALKAPMKSTCKSNARPVQPLNGRQVELYDELS